jgi:hypothetical protein
MNARGRRQLRDKNDRQDVRLTGGAMLREVSRSARRRNGNGAQPTTVRCSNLSQPFSPDRIPGSLIGHEPLLTGDSTYLVLN